MSLSSSFTHFSLAELFQLIDQGRKSGCLTVCTLPDLHTPKSKSQYFYIWIRHGRVVAASNRLNGQALIDKITRRGWVQPQVIKQLCTETTVTPVGLHLKNQGILNAEQLNLLFANQLQQIRELFEIQKGVFKLDSKAILPWSEMTGLSLRAMEVALMALRVLKNWDVLADVLPNANSAIQNVAQKKPELHLHPLEWQVWEFSGGQVPLKKIASQLNQPVALVQQAALRLILVGLVEEVEVPIETSTIHPHDHCLIDWALVNSSSFKLQKSRELETSKISTSFLQNLVGFLKSKA
jgi:hypothetical protein